MAHFVTLFPKAKNVHLVKGVGQIAFQMQQHFGYRSTLVCCKNESKYSYLKSEVPGLNIHHLEKTGKQFFWEKAAVRYLVKNAKKIDVLNLYHLTQESMFYGMIYKYLNPKGIIYLKLDLDFRNGREKITFSKSRWKDLIYHKLYPRFLEKTDIVSIESKHAKKKLKKLDKPLYEKTFVLPIGIDFKKATQKKGPANFSEKDDLILTVGRIGSKQKNSELLLEALRQVDLGNWKMKFIGPIEDRFKPKINEFFLDRPSLKGQVTFTGRIDDRSLLMDYYKKAKIFCLPSRWESFGTVLIEAQSMGNYLIGTDGIESIYVLTEEGKYGKVIESENSGQLKAALTEAMQYGFYDKELMNNIVNHSKNYKWPVLLDQLEEKIQGVEQSR